MKRTKLVQVSRGGISIEERIRKAMLQYSINEDSLIEVRINEEKDGSTKALIIYDPDRRKL